jgi:acetylornithine deacetylase/succinyl-diaminopimelate desuccinylase-like protein
MTLSEKLARAIQLDTISSKATDERPNVFDRYHDLMAELFPLIHETCEKTIINDFSLVYKWAGTDPAINPKPIILIAHYDVVPIEKSTLNQWTYEPFSGHTVETYV